MISDIEKAQSMKNIELRMAVRDYLANGYFKHFILKKYGEIARGGHRVLRAPSCAEVVRGKPWTLKYLNYFRPDFEPSRHV